jgi:hypothetical protein
MARRRSQDDEIGPEIERLYALPPAAFTAARNELAARLRREGRRDAAVKVKALPRPTPSSWAVSRLMRLEPARFQALLAAGSQARQAQERVLRGGAALAGVPAARLREALATARQTLEELRRRGLELLAAAGKPPTAQTADRLAADLQALAFTAGAESAIARGWLDHDLEAPGFEVLAGLQAAAGRARASPAAPAPVARAAAASGPRRQGPHLQGPGLHLQGPGPRRLRPGPSPAPQPPPARASAAPRGEEEAAARRRQLETRRRAEQTRREQARFEQARERARARLAAAEAEVERAAAESARLTAAAAAAEREAADARRRAEDAEREAERARRASERASRLLEQARARLAAAHAAADRVISSRAGQPSADETR